jgi:ATP-dependent Clp protease adaptor protein ClpS
MEPAPASRNCNDARRPLRSRAARPSLDSLTLAPVRPAEAPVEEPRSIDETLPPYRVVLHNDDVNSMDHVVRSLVESVPELSMERAVEIMLEAHLHDRAEVIVCPLERAELYRDRLTTFQLTATVERA